LSIHLEYNEKTKSAESIKELSEITVINRDYIYHTLDSYEEKGIDYIYEPYSRSRKRLIYGASFTKLLWLTVKNSIARTTKDFCDKLFAIEAELDKCTTEERFKERLTQEKPVSEEFLVMG